MRLRLRLRLGLLLMRGFKASAPLATSNYTLMVNNYHNNNNNNGSGRGRRNNDKTYSARCQHYKEIVITIMAQ